MSAVKSAAILFTGESTAEKVSYAKALQEVLITNGSSPVILDEKDFPFLSSQNEPEWSRGILQTSYALAQSGYFVLIPVQLNDASTIEKARAAFSCFKEVYLKTAQTAADSRKPKLPELMIQSDLGDFDKGLKQILDWLASQKMIEKQSNSSPSVVALQEADVIREKLKSLGYL